jgi:KDO2-lipid IV(A) lauroyltransferase
MNGRRLRHRLEYAAFLGVISSLRIIPVPVQRLLSWLMAMLVCRVVPKKLTRYHIAFDNIRQAFGDEYSDAEVDRIIFDMWQHLFRLVSEVVQFPKQITMENTFERIQFRNREDAVCALVSGRPVILLSGHFGNWETSVTSFGVFGFQLGVVARALDNPYLDAWFERFRESTGHTIINKGGARAAIEVRLAEGRHVAILADQDAGQRGIFIDFFGRPASAFPSVAQLAMRNDALIVMGCGIRQPDNAHQGNWVRYEVSCEDVIDPRDYDRDTGVHEITQRFSAALESAVRRAPEQYFWIHRRWKTRPAEEQAVGRAA